MKTWRAGRGHGVQERREGLDEDEKDRKRRGGLDDSNENRMRTRRTGRD